MSIRAATVMSVAAALICAAPPASAAIVNDGQPDPGFGSNGTVFAGGLDGGASLVPGGVAAIEPGDAGVVLATEDMAEGGTPEPLTIVRLDSAGREIGAPVTLPESTEPLAMRILADGTIVILTAAEGRDSDSGELGLLHLNADGTQSGDLVPVSEPAGCSGVDVVDGALRSDGSPVVLYLGCRFTEPGSEHDYTGYLIASFAATGSVTHATGLGQLADSGRVGAVGVDGSDRVVLEIADDGASVLTRYDTGLQQDASWASDRRNGEAPVDDAYLFRNGDLLIGVAPGGRVVTPGSRPDDGQWTFDSFTPSGEADQAFGDDGVSTVTAPASAPDAFGPENDTQILPLDDGRTIVAGIDDSEGDGYTIARLTPSGALDPSFGTDGVFRVSAPGQQPEVGRPVLQSDGKVVVPFSELRTSTSTDRARAAAGSTGPGLGATRFGATPAGGPPPPAAPAPDPTTPATPAPAPPVATPVPSAALACTNAQAVLIDVVQHGSRAIITGAARLPLAGQHVAIKLLATGKVVARPLIGADGAFDASVPLPPKDIRDTNEARYQGTIGTVKTAALKFARRAHLESVQRTGAHVTLTGRVTNPFKPGTKVTITLRITCATYQKVATTKLTRTGTFTATVPAPTGDSNEVAVYRATTSVLTGHHPEPTATLPQPPV